MATIRPDGGTAATVKWFPRSPRWVHGNSALLTLGTNCNTPESQGLRFATLANV